MIWNFLKNLFHWRASRLTLFGRTDTGRTRPNNEDSFIVLPKDNLMMVADGMGGHNAGEVASRAAIESMTRLLGHGVLREAGPSQAAIRHLLIHGLLQTNDTVMRMADDNEAYAGMGSTFIVAYAERGHLFTCHVGDVRAYLLTPQGLRQITTDHTYAAEYAKAHADEAADETSPPQITRNIVSRAIGFPFSEDPECTTTPISAGHRILLCSDGLWSMLPDPQLATVLGEAATPEEACDRLISLANQAGGKDNVTAVVGFV